MHNFTLASPPIPNIKFLSFVVSEKCVMLKICTVSKKNQDFTRKKQQINLNFELALNNSIIMLPTKNYVDRPKTKSVIALTKIILKICTFSIKKHDFTRKKQQINLNFELTLNNSVIMLPTKRQLNIRSPAFRQNISRLQLRCNSAKKQFVGRSLFRVNQSQLSLLNDVC